MAQKRHRYPAYGLRQAIEGIAKIFNEEHRSSMPPRVAASHLGYTSLNGASLKSIAALKKYGLLEGRGDDLAVTQDAITILVDKEVQDQSERAAALSRALVRDSLFKELFEKFGESGSAINIIAYLTKKGFMQSAARKATDSFLDSLAFVREEIGDYNITELKEIPEETSKQQSKQHIRSIPLESTMRSSTSLTASLNTSPHMTEIAIPLPGVEWPVLKAQIPMSPDTWDKMIVMLTAMKPALVVQEEGSSTTVGKSDQGNE